MFLLDSKKIAKVIFSEIIKSDEKNINKLINNFFGFCKKNKIEKNIKNILKYIEIEYKNYKKQNTIFIESPFKQTEKELDNIIDNTLGKGMNQTESMSIENKELIGGFILRFKNKIYDASLSTQIDKLKSSMKKS